MRAMTLMVPMLALAANPVLSQMPQSPCPSGVVHWQVAGHFVEGDLTEIPEAGRPLKVHQAGINGTRDLPVTSDGLACRVNTGGKGKGALIGAGIGLATGALLGAASGDDTCDSGWCFFRMTAGQKALLGGVLLGAAGGLVGAIAAPSTTWAPLRLLSDERRIGLSLSGKGVGLRVTF